MWLNNHHWHFDYVRLARDTGFTFEKTKFPLDKNKICLIDLVKIIGEGDVGTIEHFMPSIVQYSIDTGEHTEVLDQNFIKLFRMSQLAVEYLLFCKKYLDHTVTSLKEEMNTLKLENNELKIFNNELKQHTDALLEKLNHTTCSFKCTKCSKAFSTEQYLIAHMERRHFDCNNVGNSELDVEMEIKEIKQKLNNTEKLMKNEDLNPKLEDTLNKNYSKVSELLLKFESLKTQVESEFKLLQTQKDFEDKYSKIFQNILDNMKTPVNTQLAQSSPYRLYEKRNSVTQTDTNNIEKIEKKIQVDRHFDEIEQPSKFHLDERIIINIEEHMTKNCEIITKTMSSAFKNLEIQMQALSEKLQEVERKHVIVREGIDNVNVVNAAEIKPSKEISDNEKKIELVQDQAKSYEEVEEQQPVLSVRSDDSCRIDIFEEATYEPSKSVRMVKRANTAYGIEESESEEESLKSKSSSEFSTDASIAKISPSEIPRPKSSSTLGKRSVTSLRKASLTTEVRDKFRKEMEQVINERLSALGLSMEWKGIPEQTYLKVMDILNHQSTLMQKSYPDCKSIRKNLLKAVNEELKIGITKGAENLKKIMKPRKRSTSLKSSTSRNSISSPRKTHSAPQIEIKNRTMFDTDSSSSEKVPLRIKKIPSNIIRSVPYSAVIEELKQKSNENLYRPGGIDENLSKVDEEIEKVEPQTKGVLKNISTTAPVPKKRVLFNLKNDNPVVQKEFLKDVGGGSTSSIASSVLDLSDGDNSSQDGQSNIKNKVVDMLDSDFSIFSESDKKQIESQ